MFRQKCHALAQHCSPVVPSRVPPPSAVDVLDSGPITFFLLARSSLEEKVLLAMELLDWAVSSRAEWMGLYSPASSSVIPWHLRPPGCTFWTMYRPLECPAFLAACHLVVRRRSVVICSASASMLA